MAGRARRWRPARFRDASLPIDERVENLLSQMTLEEKAGLFFQTMITMGEDGELADADPMFGLPSTEEYGRSAAA